MSKNNQEKLGALRDLMAENHVDAYLIPRGDEYLGEFVADYAERLAWLTGFTGSAGTAIVTADQVIVMSDGRYTIQLKDQLDPALFTAENSVETPLKDWLHDNLPRGSAVAYDPKLYAIKSMQDLRQKLDSKDIQCKAIEQNFIDTIWVDQPDRPNVPAYNFSDDLAGLTSSEKLAQVTQDITGVEAQGAIITKPDSTAWLLNVRGGDLEFMPVTLSVAVIDAVQSKIYWLVDESKAANVTLPKHVEVVDPDQLGELIERLDHIQTYALDGANTPEYYLDQLNKAGKASIDAKDPCIARKARKHVNESDAIFDAHIIDGAAIVKTLAWLDGIEPETDEVSELDVVAKLAEFRSANPAYKGESFPAITGFAANGAIVHYRATNDTNALLDRDGLLLVDTGGQYYDLDQECAGTTDITRTVWIGDKDKIDPRIKQHFTYVLKGHINLAMSAFTEGTTGEELDAVARQPLLDAGLNYAHGTGHGVGCFGDVHEEAAHISPRGTAALEEGMLLSNEPGYYEEGSHGIRIENLVFVIRHEDDVLGFNTVTLAPVQREMIDLSLMDEDEIVWLNDYHAWVREELSPLLDGQANSWLTTATQPL